MLADAMLDADHAIRKVISIIKYAAIRICCGGYQQAASVLKVVPFLSLYH